MESFKLFISCFPRVAILNSNAQLNVNGITTAKYSYVLPIKVNSPVIVQKLCLHNYILGSFLLLTFAS